MADVPPPKLSDLLAMTVRSESTHRWAEAALLGIHREAAAELLAKHIVRFRCGGAPKYIDAWAQRYDGGPAHAPDLLTCLEAYVASESIGTRSKPAAASHLEGFVAEHIWYLLTSENALTFAEPVRIDGPDWSVTDSGGDGLVVYRLNDILVFRLWESKAHSGEGEVREVVNGACRQVSSNALRYLARFSMIGQHLVDDDLRRLYGTLAEKWRQGSSEAGAGIAVATKSTEITDCFDSFPSYWGFANDDQRHGLVVSIDDYPRFAERVREHLWKGL